MSKNTTDRQQPHLAALTCICISHSCLLLEIVHALLLTYLHLPCCCFHWQVVSCLEPRAEPAHVAWKGAALLAALDAGRENWLPRHQWVDGGMVLPAPPAAKGATGAAAAAAAAAASKKAAGAGAAAAAAGAGSAGAGAGSGGATGSGSNSTAAAGRHTKLFYYCRAEQGML